MSVVVGMVEWQVQGEAIGIAGRRRQCPKPRRRRRPLPW